MVESHALRHVATEIFKEDKFDKFKTMVGIVSTDWDLAKPKIFKNVISLAHLGKSTFVPGFGCTIADAIVASCSAYPVFSMANIEINGNTEKLPDGGYCANNPTLYARTDALKALRLSKDKIKVLSLGVGNYPDPNRALWDWKGYIGYWPGVPLLQRTLTINTTSLETLGTVLFTDMDILRVKNLGAEL